MKMGELQDDIRFREHTIKALEEEKQKIQSGINDMIQELEAKGKEVLKVRSEANRQMK